MTTAKSIAFPNISLSGISILLASLFIGLMAQIQIPLFFSPVPFTGQTLAIMIIAPFFGAKQSALIVMTYLLEGMMGLPVFAGGSLGFMHLFGPTGGYLIGFVIQAYLIGLLFEKKISYLPAFMKITLPSLLQLTIGSLWLSRFVGIDACFALGFTPFLAPGCLKALIASTIVNRRDNSNI